MKQRSLDFEAARRAKVALTHQAELRRVSKSIAGAVHEFLSARLKGRTLFRLEELRQYVVSRRKCAPGSAGRILRDARKHGWCGVENVDRSGSEYRVVYVRPLSEWVAPKRSEADELRARIANLEERKADCEARLRELEEAS
jgi:hypothetical protein